MEPYAKTGKNNAPSKWKALMQKFAHKTETAGHNIKQMSKQAFRAAFHDLLKKRLDIWTEGIEVGLTISSIIEHCSGHLKVPGLS